MTAQLIKCSPGARDNDTDAQTPGEAPGAGDGGDDGHHITR